jgi:hypothetical protein
LAQRLVAEAPLQRFKTLHLPTRAQQVVSELYLAVEVVAQEAAPILVVQIHLLLQVVTVV